MRERNHALSTDARFDFRSAGEKLGVFLNVF